MSPPARFFYVIKVTKPEKVKVTWAFSSDHQFNGMTRILGIAASAAGAPERICFDCTHSAGTERARDDCI